MKKKDLLWYTTLALFALFTILGFTGLFNWLFFSGGHGAGNHASPSAIRNFFCNIHGWAGFLFIIIVSVHLFLHLDYIKTRLKKNLT